MALHLLGGSRCFDATDSDHYNGFKRPFNEPHITFERDYHNGIMAQNGKPFGKEATVDGIRCAPS